MPYGTPAVAAANQSAKKILVWQFICLSYLTEYLLCLLKFRLTDHRFMAVQNDLPLGFIDPDCPRIVRFRISRTFNDVQQTSEEAPRNFLLPRFIRMKYADGVSILQSLRNIVISVLFLSFSARSNIFARQVQYPDWEPSCAFPPGFSYIHMEPALPEGSVGLNQFA